MKLRIDKAKNVSVAERNLVAKWVKKCLKELAKKDYEIADGYDGWRHLFNPAMAKPVKYADMIDNINVYCKGSGQVSNGGAWEVNIDIKMAHREAKVGKFHEYKAFENDPVIGAFKTDDVEAVIAATVAHEVAHHVQYRYGPCTRWLKKSYRKPHGDGFKDIYRILRARVVNPVFLNNDVREAA